MNTRIILFLAFTLCLFRGLTQTLEFNNPDTLTFDHRTGGIIDTFDLSYSFPFSSMPSTGFSNRFQTPTVITFIESPSLFAFQTPTLLDRKIVSALPHIGFSYSFGLKGTQFLHADYQHSLKKNTLLNASVDRQSSAGFAQNNGYGYNIVKFGLYRNHKRFDISLKGAFSNDERELSNGIEDNLKSDLDSANLGIEFVPATNLRTASIQKGINSSLRIKYNLVKDSSLLKFGPMIQSKYKLLNRVYSDELDSLNDQSQDASISNGIGFYLSRKNFSINGQAFHRYWRLQNLGTNQDTNEVSFQGEFLWKRKSMALEITHYQNIIGAKGELDFRSRFKIGETDKAAFAFANFSDLLPIPIQRSYFGKYIEKYTTPLSKQKRLNAGVGGSYSFNKIAVKAKLGILNTANNFVWTDSSWTVNNENSSLNLMYFDIKAHLNLGFFNWHPQAIVQTGSEYIPQLILSGRVLVKKKVFEAKKLELQFSIDPQFNSSYKLLSYDVNLDNFYFNNTNRTGGMPFSLHSTISLGIQEFRFFIRGENLQAFWTKGSTEVLQNYYRSPFVLRLGLSWDFFN